MSRDRNTTCFPKMSGKIVTILFAILSVAVLVQCQSLFACHDDPAAIPEDGAVNGLNFMWLGSLQYIHVKNGTPHYFRVPRVVLISRLFVLSTAVDAAQIPDGYALGNVVFGDYERDEQECGVTVQDFNSGALCEPAVVLMPIADVLLHPEYKHFGAKNSIALLKLVMVLRSEYMLPVCLPYKNFMMKDGKLSRDTFVHIDFMSESPRDYIDEEKELSRIALLPRELCFLYDHPKPNKNLTNFVSDRMACTTGCGFHSGAPSVVHEHTGHWSIVAIAQGGSPCPDPLRVRRPAPPPRHLLLHPYVPWITAAITGKAVGSLAKDDPFGFVLPRAQATVGRLWDQFHFWVGHWWMGGLRCHDRGEAADDMFRFYHEVFSVQPIELTRVTYYLEITAPTEAIIICVKVGIPFRIPGAKSPTVWNVDSPQVKVSIPLVQFQHRYKLQVDAWAYNSSDMDSSITDEDE